MAQRPPQTSVERWLTIGGVILSGVALLLILAGLFVGRGTLSSGGTQAAPQIGSLAPDFTLLDTTNTPVHLKDLRGRPTILNFWYVACEGCKIEMPRLGAAYRAHAPAGLVILGIDIADGPQEASEFARRLGATYPLVFDGHREVLKTYQVTATPTTFFIDREGVIRAMTIGTLDDAAVQANLAKIGL